MDHLNEQKLYGRKVRLLIIGILIVLSLITFLFIMGKDASCDKCTIKFKNQEVSGMKLEKPITYNIPVNDLYNELLNNKCIVTFDRTQGYMVNDHNGGGL